MATSPLPQIFTVSGHVFDEFNTMISGAIIQAFDKDLRSEQLLGERVTDINGFYNITFNSIATSAKEYKTPDVFIKVFNSNRVLLGKSEIVFNIEFPQFTIDFKVGNTEIKPLNEFDALLHFLQPLLTASNLQFKDLVEKEPNHDISFLAGETGADQTFIELLVKAFQLEEAANKSLTAQVPRPTITADISILFPPVFYGLLRQGFPAVLNQLLQKKANSITKALQQAMVENIISAKFEKRLDEIIKLFNELSVIIVVNGQ